MPCSNQSLAVKDASRSLDYVDSRPDLDHEKIGYYGYSWGAVMGAIIPAVDTRIKAIVLALGGMEYSRSLPEVDKINFLPRVQAAYADAQRPLRFFLPRRIHPGSVLQLAGTKKEQKKRIHTKPVTTFRATNSSRKC